MFALKNEKGFALVLILSLLPVIIGVSLAVMFSMNYMRMNAHHLHICRTESIKTMNEVGDSLETLLKLNKVAKALRIEKIAADAAVIAAIAAYGYGLPFARAWQQSVKLQRLALDIQQKALIMKSNAKLIMTYTKTQMDLRKAVSTDLGRLKPFIDSNSFVSITKPPLLAVRPDKTDIAPVYNTLPQFEKRMTMAHRWQYTLEVAQYLRNFLKGEQKFYRECAVTLVSRGSKWEAEIREDKSLLRSVF